MGTVYLAQDRHGRAVALKVLHEHLRGDPLFRHRFAQEVTAAARVASFCTARVLDADPHACRPFLVTEYVDGISLHERVTRQGPLPEADAAALAVGVAAALTAIHAAGVMHRDLKPSNVMLAPVGPKVIDFGIAGAIHATEGAVGAVRFGTPGWLAPEQLAGHPAGPPADVYAWALLVVWAATGRHAFGAGAKGTPRVPSGPVDLSGLPAGLLPVVRACLVPDPLHRPAAREVLLRLCGAADAGLTATVPTPLHGGSTVAPTPTRGGSTVAPTPTHGGSAGVPSPVRRGSAGVPSPVRGSFGVAPTPVPGGSAIVPAAARGASAPSVAARPAPHPSRPAPRPARPAPRPPQPAAGRTRRKVAGPPPTAPPRTRPRRRRFLRRLVLLLVVGLVLAAWVANGRPLPQFDVGANPDPGPTGGVAPGRRPPAEQPKKVQHLTARDGAFEFTVTGVRCGESELGDWPIVKRAQGMFCLVELEVSNIGGHTGVVFPGSQRLVDAAGIEHGADGWAWVYYAGTRSLASGLDPGDSVSGTLVFDVPLDTEPVRLVVHDTPMSRGTPLTL